MSPPRAPLLALALLSAGCAGKGRVDRANALPPPATESRAGTLHPGAGPAPGSSAPRVQARAVPRETAVQRAVDVAAGQAGQRQIVVEGVRYGDGCVSLVRAALAEAGSPLPSHVRDAAALIAHVRASGGTRRARPAPGDLVFLADRPGGPAEHVGLVQSVASGGTVLVLHHTERGVARIRLNAAEPWKARTESGKALNDVLIVGAGRITAGRLLVGYATVL
jgi:cell wall-associated NlpC family hydrolase